MAQSETANTKLSIFLDALRLLCISLSFSLLPIPVSHVIFANEPWLGSLDWFFGGVVCIFTWVTFVLPLNLLVLAVYHWRNWRKFRALFVFLPSIYFLGDYLVNLALDPPTVSKRFEWEVGMPIPASAQDFHYKLYGGGITDYGDVYYFRCSRVDFDQLIKVLHLQEDTSADKAYHLKYSREGWPDMRTWKGAKVYSHNDDDANWYYTLVANEDKNEVYLFIDSI